MRKTVDKSLDRVVYALVSFSVKIQTRSFNLLVLAFGMHRVGVAFQTLMRSNEVVQMAVNAGVADVPNRIADMADEKLKRMEDSCKSR